MAKNYAPLASLTLRIGLALVFLYAAIASLLNPGSWSVYLPSWIGTVIPLTLFLTFFSIYQILLALWLLSGKYIYPASLLAALTLLGIIFHNIADLDIIFRDIAIFSAAVALALLSYLPKYSAKK